MDVVVPKKRRRLGIYVLGVVVLITLAALTVGLANLERAAPRVVRSTVWIDSVRRGEFTREVSAPGSLVSDEVRLVTARVAGVVDRIHVKAGAQVEPETLLLELSNPDLEVDALEAATAVKEARAELLNLRATLGIQRLEQRSALENTRVQQREAKRRSEANEPLAERKIVAALDIAQMREHASELQERLRMEEEHALALGDASAARVTAQRAKVEGLSAQAELRAGLVANLQVRARAAGMLAELAADVGQQVSAGTVLGKVINQQKLKAELRVPEARAKEVAVGQSVTISVQNETVTGRVTRIDPTVQQGNVRVEVSFEGEPPRGARLDLSVDGRIQMERVSDVLYMGKPASAGADGTISLFRVLEDGRTAQRVRVRLGRSSVNSVEIVEGLRKGDRVILSNMSEWDTADRIELE